MISTVESNKSQERRRLVFFAFLIIFSTIALSSLPRLAIPLALAYILNLILSPLVPFIRKFGTSKQWAILIVFIMVFSFLVYPLVKVFPTLQGEVDNFQFYAPKVEKYIRENFTSFNTFLLEKTGHEIPQNYFIETMEQLRTASKNVILKVPNALAYILEGLFIVPLFLFFFMRDGRKYLKSFMALAPNSLFERLFYLFHQFNKKIGDYIFAKFIEAMIVGSIIGAGLSIMGVRFALILGLVAGVTNIVPYIGPVLGMVPAVILGLAEYGQGATLGGIIILYLVANAIDLAVVFPLLVSKIVDLHPIIVIISVIVGSQFFGFVGMIVSIPMAAALKLVFKEIQHSLYAGDL